MKKLINRGRPSTLVSYNLKTCLESEDAGTMYLNKKLVAKGFFTILKMKKEGRGRPAFKFVRTKKAEGFLKFAANWGKIENVHKKAFIAELEVDFKEIPNVSDFLQLTYQPQVQAA